MTSDPAPQPPHAARVTRWRPKLPAMVLTVMLLTSVFWVAAAAKPAEAQAAKVTFEQCNGHGPGAGGASTALRCTVTVVNTISGTATSSTTTMTRLCLLGPCSAPNGTTTTISNALVTAVRQCNSSDNDAAHSIACTVNITNNIWADTPGAQPLSAPRITQCVGSGKGGLGVVDCEPGPVSGAALTQCNGSGNGGGGTVHCTVDARSRVSSAIPITVNQCDNSGDVGRSALRCGATTITNITNITNITGPALSSQAPTTTPAPTTTTTATSSPTPAPADSTAPAVVAANGAGPAANPDHRGLLMLGSGLTLAAALSALLYRRYAAQALLGARLRAGLLKRFGPKG